MKITKIVGLEILDSRGNPTIETILTINNKYTGIAKIPSGASTGTHEALELRDNDDRYHGKGVKKAIKNIQKIFNAIKNKNFKDQYDLDNYLIKLDGTKNKSKYGANAILGISMAFCVAYAKLNNVPLYQLINNEFKKIYKKNIKLTTKKIIPLMNIINGGAHADNEIDIQEFMIVPIGPKTISEKIRAGAEIFHNLKKILKSEKQITSVGDEGGFAPNLKNTEEVLSLIEKTIKLSNYNSDIKNITKDTVLLALDCASSEYFKDNKYYLDKQIFTPDDLINYYKKIIDTHPIISIEDPFAEDDWDTWKKFTILMDKKINIVGDDLFVTNIERLKKGIENKIANSILIKLNQIGTVSETLSTIALAKSNNYKVIISHRSGETEDNFISDLAIGVDADYIKTGSLSRSDRLSKYNRLIEIENEIN